jgi:hypothetical protein
VGELCVLGRFGIVGTAVTKDEHSILDELLDIFVLVGFELLSHCLEI